MTVEETTLINDETQLNNEREHQTNNETQNIEIFGNVMEKKMEHELRIIYININSLPTRSSHPKNRMIYDAITTCEGDVLAMTEINKYWPKVEEQDKWRERTLGWWRASKTTLAYNRKDITSSTFQPGGVSITSIDTITHRCIGNGVDESGLGRWAWQLFRGKDEITIRTIVAYRPCKPSVAGPSTAYNQQRRYFDAINRDICPREAIKQDLGMEIEKWREEGNQIVLMMDVNEPINSDHWKRWLRQHRLKEGISSQHGNNTPSTHSRGSKPIDGLFCSYTIQFERSGYLPFGTFPSDHRALWADIKYELAFGYKMPSIVRPPTRRVRSDDPRSSQRFNSLYSRYIQENRLHIKLFNLEAKATVPMTIQQKYQYEQIMKTRNRCLHQADKKSRKLRMGSIPYSPELNLAQSMIELWKAVRTKKRGAKYSNNKLRRLEKKVKIFNTLQTTAAEAEQNEKRAWKNYWEIKRSAQKLHETYEEGKSRAIAISIGKEFETIHSQRMNQRRIKKAAQRVSAALGKFSGGTVTQVIIPLPDGTTRTAIQKQDIELECLKVNEDKFRQTEHTPLMRQPLCDHFGFDGKGEAITQVLLGNYVAPPNTNRYVIELLNQMKHTGYLMSQEAQEITTTQFKEGWKKAKEDTGFGMSGVHFGHMKSCTKDPFLAEFESSLAHLPYYTGYSPSSWTQGINNMIQKRNKSNLITKLRTIVLSDSNFNFNNKLLGKTTLAHAEENNLLAREQYGSRKGKSAIEHVVNKRIMYDLLRQYRKPGALCSNDAIGCFDRMVHSVVMLAYKRLGVPEPAVHCMLESIRNMKHYIRTGFGLSTMKISSEGHLIPYQGALQGNGAAPTSWVIISTPLLNMLRAAGHGCKITSAISKEESHSVGFAFVDDTDITTCYLNNQEVQEDEVMHEMQQAMNRWAGGLKATGGAIDTGEKTWVYPISFKFDESGKWSYKTTEEIDATFRLCDHNDNLRIIS